MIATEDPIRDVSALAPDVQSSRAILLDARGGLRAVLDHALDMPGAAGVAAPFLAQLVLPERSVRAILLYGSCLWSSLRGPTSHPDFFVIVNSLRTWHDRLSHSLLNVLLPPSIYRLRVGGLQAKISVTSEAQIGRHCGIGAPDLHHLGRLSKRVALVWSRDEASRQLVVDAQESALLALARLVRPRLGEEVDVDEFMTTLLRLSYEAEVRIAEHGKAEALFQVEREHYRAVGRELLVRLGAVAGSRAPQRRLPPITIPPAQVQRTLRRSRRRAVLRWPKYICTYDGWVDYVMAKLARTGDRLSLTPRQRRHPLLFGIPVLWRLGRDGRLT